MTEDRPRQLPFEEADGCLQTGQLGERTGRSASCGEAKGARFPPELPPILERLGLQPSGWLDALRQFPDWFKTAIGGMAQLCAFAERLGQQWLQGVGPLAGALAK